MAGPWDKYQATPEAQPSGPWSKYAQPAQPVEAQAPPVTPQQAADADVRSGANPRVGGKFLGSERLGRLSDQVMDPFGVFDELSGVGAGIRQFAVDEFSGKGANWENIKDAYSQAAGRQRAERRVARDENGILPEIVGGIGTSAIGKGFTMAPNLLARVGQSAKSGAAYGGAAGYAQGEGGVTNRLLNAGEGAAIGAVAGPVASEVVLPAVGAVARATGAAVSPFANAVNMVRGKGRNLDARLNRSLENQNMTPGMALKGLDDAEQAAKFGKTQLDPRFAIADLGPSTRDLADTAALVSGEARTEGSQFLFNRARDQYSRVNDYLKRGLQVTRANYAKTQGNLVDEQRSLSKKAYDAAYADKKEYDVGQVLFDRQFDEDAAAGPLKNALTKARELFVDQNRAPGYQTSLTTQRFDAGKRALDDMIGGSKREGRNNEARLLTQLKQDLLGVIDSPKTGNPLYKDARDVYSSRAELLESMEAGRKFMRGDSEITGQAYRSLSTGEKRTFRLGIAQQVRRDLGAKRVGTDMIGYFDRPNVREVLGEIMTPGQAGKFYQLIELEQAMAATNQAVRGNSKTAQRQQNVLDFSLGVRLGRNIKDQGLYAALSNEVFDQVSKAFAMREQDAVAVTRALFETDPAKQRETINRLIQTYGRGHAKAVIDRAEKIARRQVATARRKLAGVVGMEASEPDKPTEITIARPASWPRQNQLTSPR